MGKLLTTTYKESVEKVTGLYEKLVNNPFYMFNDSKPTVCTYYSINRDFSSVDIGGKFIMDNIGEQSPLRFNRIYGFLIHGFNKVQLQTDLDEFGLESDKITGDCVVLPNFFVPIEGDYFEVEHIKDSTYLFIVTDVQKDTLNNGANAYKISYKLEYNKNVDLVNHVVYNYRAIEARNGLGIQTIVRCEDFDLATKMDRVASTLKKYFCELFYDERVQTFIYEDLTEFRIYDQFMIEFLIRHEILNNGEDLSDYIHVCHQLKTPKTFTLDYDETFLRAFELKDIQRLLKSKKNIIPKYLEVYGSIFHSRYKSYYTAEYVDKSHPPFNTYCLSEELLYAIQDHTLVPEDIHECELDPKLWQNIIIKYFYDEDITEEELRSIENIKFTYAKNAFYLIPILIFCLESYITKALK